MAKACFNRDYNVILLYTNLIYVTSKALNIILVLYVASVVCFLVNWWQQWRDVVAIAQPQTEPLSY